MGGFYSLIVWAQYEVMVPRLNLTLEVGINAFNAQVDDVDDFIQELSDLGCTVREVNRLNEKETDFKLPSV